MNCKFQNKSGLYLDYFDLFSELVSKLEFKKIPNLGSCHINLKMNCKFQNKSGLYLGYFDVFFKSVSQLELKKSSIHVYVIPNLKSIEILKKIWVLVG